MIKCILYILSIPILLASCLSKENLVTPRTTSPQSEWAFPLIKSRLTIKDFIKEGNDSLLNTEINGLFYLSYPMIMKSRTADQIIILPDQTKPTFDIPLQGQVFQHNFNFNNQGILQGTLNKADLKAGTFQLSITTNNNSENFNITITFPTMKNKDGKTFTISGNSQKLLSFTLNGDLAGQSITFNDGPSNTIDFVVTTNATKGTLSASLAMTNLKYSVLYGTFENIQLGYLSEVTNFDIFNKKLNGSIRFANPSVELNVTNSFGAPLLPNKQHFQFSSKSNSINEIDAGELEPFESKVIEKPSIIGSSANSVFKINNNNSTDGNDKVSLKTALSQVPKYFKYGFNPVVIKQPNSFILDSSKVTFDGTLKIPFDGAITSYSFQDTLDFSMSNMGNPSFAEFVIGTENNIPLQLKLQVYFVNSFNGYTTIDSIFSNPTTLLKYPTLDNNSGRIVSPGVDRLSAFFTEDRLKGLKGADKILIKSTIQTPQSSTQDVKFFIHNYLDIRISIHFKVNPN